MEKTQELLEVYFEKSYHSKSHTTVFLPHPLLLLGSVMLEDDAHFNLGSQDVSEFLEGNHTGEVSAKILKDLRVSYCLIGHSEVRSQQKLSETQIHNKLLNCLEAGITPIICVGFEEDPKEGVLNLDNLKSQVDSCLAVIPKDYGQEVFWAFEPTFAIGSGTPATVDQVQKAVDVICTQAKDFENVVLYGGSLTGKNYEQFLEVKGLGGFLVGKSSLSISDLEQFLA